MSESHVPADAAVEALAASPVEVAVRLAVYGAASGDADSWQLGVRQALELDPAAADRAARAELLLRAQRHGIRTGMVVEIAYGSTILSLAADDGPFQCPAYLLELALRRALGEPGCVDFVDETELIYATTQCAGLVDLHDALLPPGWGWSIQLPIASEV